MLNKLIHLIKNDIAREKDIARTQEKKIDPSTFNDTVANKTSWEPISTSATNFNTRKLSKKNEDCISFVPTYSLILFCSFFIVMGLTLNNDFGLLSAGSIFIFGGSVMLFMGFSPIVFDKKESVFFKGRGLFKKRIYFSDIYSLQLLLACTDSDNGYYWNPQLNIILKDGKRQHVVSWNDKVQGSIDAEEIARMVGVKLWNTVVESNYKTEPERTIRGIVHSDEADGRRKLNDWKSMPLLMKAGFIATDSYHAHYGWSVIFFFAFTFFVYFKVMIFIYSIDIENGFFVGVSYFLGMVLCLALFMLLSSFIKYVGHVLRAVTNMWYEDWRLSSNKDRT